MESAAGPAEDSGARRPIFISYATSDRKQALAVCEAIERRGARCWIACRDVLPGENYQEAIVRAIRGSRALVLVFSEAANNSDEIKKELSLVSRHRVPLMALRLEDVEPSDAFAYELSTRQWIDAFEGWDRSIDTLVRGLDQVGDRAASPPQAAAPPARRRATGSKARRIPVLVTVLAGAVFVAALAAWLLLRPTDAAAHSMQVRLTGFQRLSPDLPEPLPHALSEEIIAAFSEDGIVTASTAATAPAGDGPAYALGGTLRQDGDRIKLIVRLTNERSGAALWSNSFSYEGKVAPRLPRVAGAEVSSIVRCGLFGASTHPRLLPDPVLTNYLGFCTQVHADQGEPSKALDFARKVVQAEPDFSTGWSAITIAAAAVSRRVPPGPQRVAHRNEAVAAAERAIRLDPRNSEAYAYKNFLIDPRDLVGREALLKQALKARPLACGCEHHFYGNLLAETGRTGDALVEFRRAVDVLALNASSQIAFAEALLAAGRAEQARQHFDAAKDLIADPTGLAEEITVMTAPATRDYAAALTVAETTRQPVPPPQLSALKRALQALQSGDAAAKAEAATQMASLPASHLTIRYLGALGANRLALRKVEEAARDGRSVALKWLFEPTLAGARADPAFPGLAERLGIMAYWRKTKTKPDMCTAASPPPVCAMI